MEIELKFKSVAWRWVLNVFTVIFLVIFFLVLIFCVTIHSYYMSKIQTKAKEYAQTFISGLESAQTENFDSVARDYCEKFEHKDKLEVQVLDANGKIIISTTGFAQTDVSMPDYDKAVDTASKASWTGKFSAGEKVYAETTLLNDNDGVNYGAVRWIVSLTSLNRRVFWSCIMTVMLATGVLTVIVISGMYFINSIVRPIRDLSNVARKIAMGDFNSRIDIRANNEIGELCDSINYMSSELQQAENMKNDFISSVSHELRTPLTAIRGWAETAKISVGEDEETVNKGLDVVLKESERLHGLVEALLDFSRMQSGRLPINMAEFDLATVLDESADMYKELAKKQDVELVYLPPREKILCFGDTNRIKQVFINVIDNALKYNQPGGQILIGQHTEDGCVQISIKDTGVGIAAQDLDRVKEKFYKANKQVRGSGIGLAVADEIVKQHNGLLLVDSTEGVGTTVTIVLPIMENDALEGETNEL